jgi:hypothetical protein
MTKLLKPLLVVIGLTAASVTPVDAVDIYVFSNNTNVLTAASVSYGRIDTQTGNYTHIATINSSLANLTWSNSASAFYVTNTVGGTNGVIQLHTMDTAGSLSASLGTIASGTNAGNSIYGMAYRPSNDTLYGYTRVNFRSGTITTAGVFVDNTVGGGLNVGAPIGGRYTFLNDTLYTTGSNNSVIPATGYFGTVGTATNGVFTQTTTSNEFAFMQLAGDQASNTLYGIYGNGTGGQQRLYTINTGTGALTLGPLIVGANLGTYFHGATVVPEPSTYALGTLAALTLGAIGRRRRNAVVA